MKARAQRAQEFRLSDVEAPFAPSGEDVSPPPMPSQRPPTPPPDEEAPGPDDNPETTEQKEKRKRIVQEIVETERDYVKHMETLKNNYEAPLIRFAESKQKHITLDGMKTIFSNLDLILGVNVELLNKIEEKFADWSDDSTLGDVFVQLAPIFKMYNDYGNNYDNAIAQYNKYMKEPAFTTQVQNCDGSHTLKLRLEPLLIMPVQRIPRYNLLLQDLLKNTHATHPDKKLLEVALQKMQDITAYLNKDIKVAENQKKFLELGKKGAKKLIKSHRKLLSNVVVQMSSGRSININPVGLTGGHNKLYLWLFTDIMVILPESKAKNPSNMGKPENIWPLNLTWIVDKESSKANAELAGPNRWYTIRFQTPQEKTQFLNDVRNTQHKQAINPDSLEREGEYEFVSGEYFQGGTYSGQWSFGRFHGTGTFTILNNVFVGSWHEGKRCGKGTLTYSTGEIYEGDWLDNRMDGQGTLTYPDGSYYVGGWARGAQEGQGEFRYSNNDVYNGEWQRGFTNGTGTLKLSNGISYSGGWKLGEFDGFGTLEYPSGKKYEGDWVCGLKEGEGTLYYPNGDVYKGRWKADKRHGQGTFTSDTEGTYEGEWCYGLKEGRGTCRFINGDVYDGQWKKGMQNGKGTMTYSTGSIVKYTGEWQNDRANGRGVMEFRNSTIFDGNFKNNRPYGNGVWKTQAGIQIFTKVGNSGFEGKTKVKLDKKRKFTGTGQGSYIVGDHKVEYDISPNPPVFTISDTCI